ncbi:MAG: AMP-binding protein [Gammaproteobacteria bacterium]
MFPAAADVREVVDAQARARGDAVFLIAPDSGEEITFLQLRESMREIGARFDALGVAAGAKVAFLLDNGAWAARLLLGVMAAGRVAVPLNAVAGAAQLRHVLGHSDAELVFVAPRHREKLAAQLAHVARAITPVPICDAHGPQWPHAPAGAKIQTAAPAARDPALLLYTSGSTGLPKGALLCHEAVVRGGRNVAGGHALGAADRALCVLPVCHINGAMVTVLAPLLSGGSVVMPRQFSARAFWPLAAQFACTWSSLVPTMINYLLDRAARETFSFGDDARLKHFRFARSASAPLPASTLAQWERVFCAPMIETLGLTETAGTVATNPMPPAARKPGAVGRAHGNEIRIIGRDGGICPPNTAGEIVIRGRNLLGEYYKDPQATRAAFAGEWFRSGDLGFLDDDGFLFVTGRLKELIIRGGENIAPREIDDALHRHPAVLEAAAVGLAHRDYGQEVAACVVLRGGFDRSCEEELKKTCAAAIGEVKAPKAIYFFDALPKGPSGKILRRELPGMIAARG